MRSQTESATERHRPGRWFWRRAAPSACSSLSLRSFSMIHLFTSTARRQNHLDTQRIDEPSLTGDKSKNLVRICEPGNRWSQTRSVDVQLRRSLPRRNTSTSSTVAMNSSRKSAGGEASREPAHHSLVIHP